MGNKNFRVTHIVTNLCYHREYSSLDDPRHRAIHPKMQKIQEERVTIDGIHTLIYPISPTYTIGILVATPSLNNP